MEEASRRNFLVLAGTAAVAVSAVPTVVRSAEGAAGRLPADAVGSLAAYVHDVRRGEVALMVEGREVIVTDHDLVARLARAFSAHH